MTTAEINQMIQLDAKFCARSLHQFIRQAWHVLEPEQKFVDNWHIVAICEHLEAVTAGLIPQLLINVPPGTMKSLICCVFWPAWVWASNPQKRFMFSSYSEALSMRDSVKTRKLILSAWYQARWPLQITDDQNTKGRFDLVKGGWRIVGSVTGKGIGEHPDFNVADDPHNVIQAESDADRIEKRNWFEGVFCVRGEVRDAKRVLIMQRLHSQDCSGIAAEKGGWTHLCFPMRFEVPERKVDQDTGVETIIPRMERTKIGFQDPRKVDGELLWPSVYTEDKIRQMENNLGAYNTAGQLQQRPSPRGGAMFQRAWFDVIGAVPAGVTKIVRYWDKAGTSGGSGARTAGVLMCHYITSGVRRELANRWLILDVVSGRWTAAEREAVIKSTADSDRLKWGYIEQWVEQEPGSGGKESAEATVGNLAGHTVQIERVTGSKEVRAEPLQAQASVKNVLLLSGKWTSEFLSEIETFPMGKLKDQVDGASGAFNKLTAFTGALTGSADVSTGKNSLTDRITDHDRLLASDL